MPPAFTEAPIDSAIIRRTCLSAVFRRLRLRLRQTLATTIHDQTEIKLEFRPYTSDTKAIRRVLEMKVHISSRGQYMYMQTLSVGIRLLRRGGSRLVAWGEVPAFG